ncbi:right-handed parallel beta-helix repeat-containing protein [Spirulina sp. 06S082]|uniref:right-handed parallel beta-helix repeat-containing protein n=1 Tax=Spirulina sp. 06S082 TaxID=3110248 RepID=UPI002B20C14B|nr:right-handed parallel beta-helix repeat-containing protein [Spirulina sp. 06S082]MEA5470855.1 right-handed parallel beta-helix repeat-containing protein [Spirulina sp. 06S082]
MNNLLSFGCTGIIFLGCLAPAIAQVTPVESTSASDLLLVEPRLGGGVSTSGAGVPRFSHLEGFAPLVQTPGESILFLEGHLSWFDYETVGTNLTLGHRFYDRDGDRIFGGYVSYDSRDTGNNRFNQIGFGFERLSDDWDLRLNGYVPFGDNRKQIGSTLSNITDASISSFGFQGNLLLFSGTQTREETRQYEAAMLAIDGEAGGKLLDISDFGQVRGYGGLYYLDASNTTALGWRARLEARALDNYIVGLGIQHDAVFGTNFIFNFGINFGGSSGKEKEEGLLARMGEFVTRNNAIIIDEQTEFATSSETFANVVATNPVTGEQWFFQHVSNTEGIGGNGTFENPFNTIVEGINAANTNSTNNQNEIVYVQFGNDIANTTAITIPDNIQLLSIAPTQTINTQLGTLQLPSSGAGTSQRPQINATVTMGNNSVLSGFNLNNITGDGISATNVSGFIVEESGLSSITGNGISSNNSSGFTVKNNSFNTMTQNGISASGSNGFTVSNNSFNTISQNGISSSSSSGFTVSNNSFNAITQNGIFASSSNGFTVSNNSFNAITQNGISASSSNGFTVSNNSFNAITQNGISASSSSGFTVSNNSFKTVTEDGISASSSNGFTVSNNSFDTVTENGIFAENSTGFTIEGNTLSNIAQYGIQGGVDNGSSIGSIVIQNNTLSNIGGGSSSGSNQYDGIFVGASNSSTITDVTISGNTISNVDNDGIAVGATDGSTLSLATITGNNVSNVGRFGIGVGVDTVSGNGSVVSNAAITSNSVSAGGTKANIGTPGANIGVAIQSNTSQVCFSLSNNILTNPPAISLASITDLQVHLQHVTGGLPVAANFDIVGGNTVSNIQSNNNSFTGNVQMYIPVNVALNSTNSNSVASCP